MPGKRTSTGKRSTKSEVLAGLAMKNPLEMGWPIGFIVKGRQTVKHKGFLKTSLDKGNRLKCAYKISGTKFSRISSSKTIFRGCGGNLQNWPHRGHGVRSIVIPDIPIVRGGKVIPYKFIYADLEQAEARVVAYIAGIERLIKLFEEGEDVHTWMASTVIFRCSEKEVTFERRYLSKKIVHAGNYKMGWWKLLITLAADAVKQGAIIPMTAAEAKKALNRYHGYFPELIMWHLSTADELRESRYLTDLLGKVHYFFGALNDDTVREAISFVPQSTVGSLLDLGLSRLDAELEEHEEKEMRCVAQAHDAVLFQAPEDRIDEAIGLLERNLIIPLKTHDGVEFTIPLGCTVGDNWEEAS